jgi:hypothetical protein
MKSFKCSECGFVGWADSDRCRKCGVVRLASPEAEYIAPANNQIFYQGYAQSELRKGMAIASLVLGIVGFFTAGLLGLGAIVGVVLGGVAMNRAKRFPSEFGGHGIAMAGLVMNITSVAMIVPVGIIAAIAIPNLLASRRAANEGGSIAILRRIQSAETTYQATRGRGSYGTLQDLVDASLVPVALADGEHYGYRFSVTIKEHVPGEMATFQAGCVPLTYGNSGIRSFYVDDTGVIRGADNHGVPATVEDPPLNVAYSSSRRRTDSPDDY